MERNFPWLFIVLLLLLLGFIPFCARPAMSLQVRSNECRNAMGVSGSCMFVWECIEREGTHLGTCAGGFLFGSCCGYANSKNKTSSLLELSAEEDTHEENVSTLSTPALTTLSYALNSTAAIQKPHVFPTVVTEPQYSELNPTNFKPQIISYQSSGKPASTSTDLSTNLLIKPNKEPPSIKKPVIINTPQKPTINKTDHFSIIQNWYSFYSTPQAYFPTIHSSYFTTSKYPFTRPSWKPIIMKPSAPSPTSNEPILFTHTIDNNFLKPNTDVNTFPKPTFMPLLPEYEASLSNSISSSSNMKTNLTTSAVNLPLNLEENVGTHITVKPFLITSNLPSSIASLSSLLLRSTTAHPFFSTTTKDKPSQTTEQYGWFSPEKPQSTEPSATSSEAEEENVISINSVHESFPSLPVPEVSKTATPASLIHFINNIKTKTETPLLVSPCGIPNLHPKQKVVGGKNAAFGSWPWQASVRRTSFFGFSSTHRCGGALINTQWIATASHCVDDLLLSQIKVRIGEYDLASLQEPFGYMERGIKKKVVHPRYNFFTYENDLALLQLEDVIDSNKYPHISPICLPPTEEYLVGQNATVTGWGRLSEGGVLPSILQEVQVPIISNEKCKNMFLAAGRHEYIPDIFMCAGFEDGGRDSCQGDSGGPLQIQSDEGYWFLAGIISWGIGCAEPNMPGVCTRISKFKDWILQQIR